ncbi:MAG: ABC transporter ATP-binding protein [Rhodobacteraceae bacterium]|jgi:peptide/nickel transport system ATP-binding protein/oligopeptide transport system ATP-binding protein|nr:ABC transporter ATP-binding protein [Paracoccaceae bacterium]
MTPAPAPAATALPPAAAPARPVLSVEGLVTRLYLRQGRVPAVDGISFSVGAGETLGIVGESGCGKSMTALSIMRLLPRPIGRIDAGRIRVDGVGDLVGLSERAMRDVRGNHVSMIFQEPMTSLNPVFRIGHQLTEAIRVHRPVSSAEARAQAVEMLRAVQIPLPEERFRSFPHQLSGGMRQRVMIAMALACRPKVMLADEPTTALDVTIQAQILRLMNDLKREIGTSIVFITHDLGVIAKMAQRVLVMYAGVVVEEAEVHDLFAAPLHPYTRGLMRSIPTAADRVAGRRRLQAIRGAVPSLLSLPRGCRFSDRCAEVHDRCRRAEPPLASPAGGPAGRQVRCWLHVDGPG